MTAPSAVRPVAFAGGAFSKRHRAIVGPLPDLSGLSPETVPPALRSIAGTLWPDRVRTEFRSVQIMTRFLTELVNAGDPLDVYASAVDLVEDEIRHTELCVAVCRGLGLPAELPTPVDLREAHGFLAMPWPARALATALGMLCVNETISTAIITDLRDRCDLAPIRSVLAATVEDEETHGAFGWEYARASLARFDEASLPRWRELVLQTLEPHEALAQKALTSIPPERRNLDAFPEPELARYGLLGLERQSLLYRRVRADILEPRLRDIGLPITGA